MTKTILIPCPTCRTTIINQCDAKCDRCKEKGLKADRERKKKAKDTKKDKPIENYESMATLYENC